MTWRSAGLPAAPLLSVCCWPTAHQSRCATHRSAAHGGCSEDRRHRVCSHVPSAQTGVPRPISARRSRLCARGGCRCSVLLLTLERDTCRVCVVPVVLTAPLLVSFYSLLVCWRSAGGAQMVVVAVVLVERLMAREKRRQELRLRATVQMKTSETVTYATEGFSGRSKAETSASRAN